MVGFLNVYETLSPELQNAIEIALDCFKDVCGVEGVELSNQDPAARAAEGLAKYIVESLVSES